MAMPRESTFLPTVKCSSCGNQVEISMMGEHLCSGAPEAPPVPQMPEKRLIDRYGSPSSLGYGRTPPIVDVGAANRPYLRTEQLIPGSPSSGAQTVSPRTPTGQTGLGQSLDYFTPQIAGEDGMVSPPQGRRPGGYGGFSESDSYDGSKNLDRHVNNDSMLERIGNIIPGPFDATRTSPSNNRTLTQSPAPMDRSGTPSQSARPIPAPRAPRKDGYGGFGPRGSSYDVGERDSPRAETFPRPSAPVEPPARAPSAPGIGQDQPRWGAGANHAQRPSMARDMARPPPLQSSHDLSHRHQNAPSSSLDVAADFGIGNPYHTPSDSGSSGYSSTSNQQSYASSQTSPARSQLARTPTEMGEMNRAINELQLSSKPRTVPGSRAPQGALSPRMDAPYGTSPREIPGPRGLQGALSPRMDAPYGTSPREMRSSRNETGDRRMPHSPRTYQMYPSSSYGGPEPQRLDRRMQEPQRSDTSPAPWRPEAVPIPSRSDSLPSPRLKNTPPTPTLAGSLPSPGDMMPPPRTSALPERKAPRDPALAPSRGDCKSCGLAIKGKSISSADGRLTGKYHKACFVCTTCSEPFTSAEFYVLNDKPFCEQHYHKLNGSLCGSCGRGIEGQYLEDEASVKYHVGCFRCLDCGHSLSNGYFEVDGRAYCERDAARRVARAPPMPTPTRQLETVPEPDPYMQAQAQRPASSRSDQARTPRPFAAGLPSGPRNGPRPPIGLPGNPRPVPGMGPGMGPGFGLAPPRPLQMNKRMTRLGMM